MRAGEIELKHLRFITVCIWKALTFYYRSLARSFSPSLAVALRLDRPNNNRETELLPTSLSG